MSGGLFGESWRRAWIGVGCTAVLCLAFVAVVPARVSASSGGVLTLFSLPGVAASSIAAGPDGALWVTDDSNNSIDRVTTTGTVTSYMDPSIELPASITVGPDGALWFTNQGSCAEQPPPQPCQAGSIGRITTSGVVTNYTSQQLSQPDVITAGPDGALWFTDPTATGTDCNQGYCGQIGRITTDGAITTFTSSALDAVDIPDWIAAGPDGALWFANSYRRTLGRITTSGAISDYYLGNIGDAQGVTTGPDGSLWLIKSGIPPVMEQLTTTGTVLKEFTTKADGGAEAGTDGALWALHDISDDSGVVYRISIAGATAKYECSCTGPTDITAGPDGNMWFSADQAVGMITTSDSVTTSPTLGPAGRALTLTGSGFNAGEAVHVKYLTGLASPKSVALCAANADPQGTFTCDATVPADAGPAGMHTIEAVGATSGIKAKTLFLRII
jgi:virginiamycin B lyase